MSDQPLFDDRPRVQHFEDLPEPAQEVDYAALDTQQDKAWERFITQQQADLLTFFLDGLNRLDAIEAIPDDEWQTAIRADPDQQIGPEGKAAIRGSQWHTLVGGMTPVQKLVHLAVRMTDEDRDQLKTQLVRMMRRAYEQELTHQAARAGCSNRQGQLRNGPILSELDDICRGMAQGIVDTYNRDLAYAIRNIAADVPTANRTTYAARLREWESKRAAWKTPQIEQYTTNEGRSRAQAAFIERNRIEGFAVLMPERAACPVCQGWINRGNVPLRVAINNPPPYHPNCPHLWRTYYGRAADCSLLWVGE
jgi:hypothetical protein